MLQSRCASEAYRRKCVQYIDCPIVQCVRRRCCLSVCVWLYVPCFIAELLLVCFTAYLLLSRWPLTWKTWKSQGI